jgi:hypothetical protein
MRIFKYKATPFYFILFSVSIWMLHQNVASQSFLTKDAVVDIDDGALIMRDDTLGFYLGGKKIGYSQFVLKEESTQNDAKLPGKYYRFQSNVEMRIQAMGIPIELMIKQSGEVNEDLTLRSFTFGFQGSGQNLYISGEVEGRTMKLKTLSEGQSHESQMEIEPPLYHTDMVHLVLAREGLEVGKKRQYTVYDALTQLGTIVLTVEDQETLTLQNGKKVDTHKVDIDLKGFHTTTWLNTSGDMHKQTGQIAGIHFTAIKESLSQAKDAEYVSDEIDTTNSHSHMDLIEHARIRPEKALPLPESISELKVKMSGAEKDDLIFDNTFQTLLHQDGKDLIIHVKRLPYDSIIASLPPNKPPYSFKGYGVAEYLKNDPLIQADNPDIRRKAVEITRDAGNSWEAANLIATWLYKEIRKEMRVTIPSAIEILTSMKGDCNEHSTLFAALARSIGLPCKIIAGLVYMDDGFYYHAWNEVYLGEQWVPIDSTLNRIKMDAAHIKISEGTLEHQAEISKLIGHIDIEILDYRN